ncbi:hypothetical protein [Legionella bononiensis]|uniref:RasGEF domain protein n=1 Tax=Legionella bononiensis TaxID=2793102 RepID=A0ABS1WBZ1_9GAMM|nr:hypothetical protein [Legionella bononiensis]MBL7481169.1 hypothetical protein [Legionella bononiensis]MBL7526878.1 hypothetical protein [Legionella bononiensis]MBL7564285.1 hypothetical protein [Legionella bononiensis]
MIAQHDTTIINQENDKKALSDELKQLINYVQLRGNEYHAADEPFKPFILGTSLNAIQKSLNNPVLQRINSAQTILRYLVEVIKLQRTIQPHLTEVHNPLITKIIDSEFILLQNVITMTQSDSSSLPLDQSWRIFGKMSELFTQLTSEELPTTKATEVKEALDKVHADLSSRDIQQKIDKQLALLNSLHADTDIDYDDFIELITSIKEQLITLKQEAQSANLVSSINLISEAFQQIDIKLALFIKRELDNAIEQIQKNPWATVYKKQQLYFDILKPLSKLLGVFTQLELSEADKRNYIHHLHAGYELCHDDDFLNLLERCAGLFYSQDESQLRPITLFINQTRESVNPARSILKKKRVHFSEIDQTEPVESTKETAQHIPKKRRLKDSESTEQPDSLIIKSFVDILTPVLKPGEMTSRKFTAAMFCSLGKDIWALKELNASIKITINYELVQRALKLCPLTEQNLLKSLQDQLSRLRNKFQRQLEDLDKFSSTSTQSFTDDALSQDDFKNILSDIVNQLKIYTEPKLIDGVVELLINKWMAGLRADGFILARHIEQMEQGIQGRSQSSVITSAAQTSTQPSSTRTFKCLSDALTHATAAEFNQHLTHLKSRMTDSTTYLNYLVNKINGSTVLHKALKNEQFNNKENLLAYINEVKSLFGADTPSFHSFLVSQTSSGFTFLHQIATLGNLSLLKSFTDLLKNELGSEGYVKALRIFTTKGYTPSCQSRVTHHEEINTFLNNERKNYPVITRRHPERDAFFKPHIEAVMTNPVQVRAEHFASSM